MSDTPVRADAGDSIPDATPVPQSGEQPLGEPIRILPLLVASAGFVALADWLFWDQPRGWTIAAYGALLAGLIIAWERKLPRGRGPVLVTIGLAALLLQCVEEPSALAVALGVLGVATLALTLREGWCDSAATWAGRWGLLVVSGWRSFAKDTLRWRRQQRRAGGFVRPSARFARNWFIPVALGLVFLLLFTAANPVLARWLSDAWRSIDRFLTQLFEHFPTASRMLTWLLVLLSVWALLRFRSALVTKARGQLQIEATGTVSGLLVRCLSLFNVLFAVQSVLDVRYLWGGAELPAGLTYAQYAHRGAYPLLAAAILAGLFVMAAFRTGTPGRSSTWAHRLVHLWLAQNLFLVISSLWRLWLYVDAYSLTRWRVAAAIWMLLVLCGLAWLVVRILRRRSNWWLVNVNAVTALVVLWGCAFINFDGLIADFNVTHCREAGGHGPPLDVPYLERLGPEALPALIRIANQKRVLADVPLAVDAIERLNARLDADLDSWRGWTWRRQRLMQVGLAWEAANARRDALSVPGVE